MKKDDIEVGETYLFVGSDSPKRKHLAGQAFTVVSKDRVYRKVSYRHKKRSMKVLRFFNDDGVGARAEELEPLPGDFTRCRNCGHWANVVEITPEIEKGPINCPECGESIAIRLQYEATDDTKDRGHGFCPKCDYPLTAWGAASDGDGDIYDEIGCDRCEEVIRKEHASYCTCPECDPWGLKADDQETDE